jgi:hypothetical protein
MQYKSAEGKRWRMLYLNQQQTHVKILKCENESSFTETVMKNNSTKREGK